jgi:hypothetical protein
MKRKCSTARDVHFFTSALFFFSDFINIWRKESWTETITSNFSNIIVPPLEQLAVLRIPKTGEGKILSWRQTYVADTAAFRNTLGTKCWFSQHISPSGPYLSTAVYQTNLSHKPASSYVYIVITTYAAPFWSEYPLWDQKQTSLSISKRKEATYIHTQNVDMNGTLFRMINIIFYEIIYTVYIQTLIHVLLHIRTFDLRTNSSKRITQYAYSKFDIRTSLIDFTHWPIKPLYICKSKGSKFFCNFLWEGHWPIKPLHT